MSVVAQPRRDIMMQDVYYINLQNTVKNHENLKFNSMPLTLADIRATNE